MELVDIVGYVAAIIGTTTMLPQAIKSINTKKVDDLSFPTLILYFVNCVLWLAYGILLDAWPVIICNAVGLVIGVILIYLKKRYGTRGA
jgi:MtN3 and saliva related transmembrane protein